MFCIRCVVLTWVVPVMVAMRSLIGTDLIAMLRNVHRFDACVY